MANDQFQEDRKMNASATKKAIIALVVGAILTSVLFYFFRKKTIDLPNGLTSQESFQGAAEISSAVQLTCQESAKKIFEEKNCADKEAEFLKNAANCLNVYYTAESDKESAGSEGNYGDLSLAIADCYSKIDASNSKAAEFLKKTNDMFDWDVYMGPITCDSKSVLAAHIENYTETRNFKCLKIADLKSLLTDLKNKKFDVLKSMATNDDVVYQGFIEADVTCPETQINLHKNLEKLLNTNFEITEPKYDEGSVNDLYLEFTKNNERILNLQFKIKTDGCLHFQSMLAPSSGVE